MLKSEAEALFDELGMSLSTAFNVFLRQAVRVQGLPFAVTRAIGNRATRAAIDEARQIMEHPNQYPGCKDESKLQDFLVS